MTLPKSHFSIPVRLPIALSSLNLHYANAFNRMATAINNHPFMYHPVLLEEAHNVISHKLDSITERGDFIRFVKNSSCVTLSNLLYQDLLCNAPERVSAIIRLYKIFSYAEECSGFKDIKSDPKKLELWDSTSLYSQQKFLPQDLVRIRRIQQFNKALGASL